MTEAGSPQVISLADVSPQTWRNGGGETRELLVCNVENSAKNSVENWRYRISVAEISANGPFSHFDSVQRHFCVLSGEGVNLQINEANHRLTKSSDALSFSGSATVDCTLIDGPTSDLNLMVRTSDVQQPTSGMVAVVPAVPWEPPNASSAGIFTQEAGVCQWRFGQQLFSLAIEYDCLVWFKVAPKSLAFTGLAWGMFICAS
jgi:uncharacterized protein